ncbi:MULTISPECIES: hypothetical protein [unclassified Arthrobacter]|uniref:hypothetical protein n=1 Tax=unclassified Arthrobacter TaxID=235627 RepID=UPI0027D78E5B|nr:MULTISPECIES: hypothetical protein [unclassified Arthrobacter]
MSTPVVTAIDTTIKAEREQELLDGFSQLFTGQKPDGLIRAELLRGQGGAWRLQTTWRDLDAIMVLRNSGETPAALALLDRLGAEHSHAVFTVVQTHDA